MKKNAYPAEFLRRPAELEQDGKINIDYDKCNNCGRCAFTCPVDAYETTEGYFVYFGGLFGNTINKGTPDCAFHNR